jgi:hypothetical protein
MFGCATAVWTLSVIASIFSIFMFVFEKKRVVGGAIFALLGVFLGLFASYLTSKILEDVQWQHGWNCKLAPKETLNTVCSESETQRAWEIDLQYHTSPAPLGYLFVAALSPREGDNQNSIIRYVPDRVFLFPHPDTRVCYMTMREAGEDYWKHNIQLEPECKPRNDDTRYKFLIVACLRDRYVGSGEFYTKDFLHNLEVSVQLKPTEAPLVLKCYQ